MVYTVDEVSDRLGIPRPTLYRYLREYSIPHLRRSGKISIPEESFDRIREARELHKEGLGTESVRQRLREGNDLDTEELAGQLDRLSGALESLQGGVILSDEARSQEALQGILKKQDLLISRVSDLTEMIEYLLTTNVRRRELVYSGIEEGTRKEESFLERLESPSRARESAEKEPTDELATVVFPKSMESFPAPARYKRFGGLGRRRRRGVMALLLALLAGAVLAWGLLASSGEEIEQPSPDEQEVEEDSQSIPAVSEAPQMVETPYLIGLTLAEAEARLAEAGLKIGDQNEMEGYTVPAGEVVAQGPRMGASVEPGTSVDLLVSGGPPALYEPGIPVGGASEVVGTGQYPVGDAQRPNGVGPEQPF